MRANMNILLIIAALLQTIDCSDTKSQINTQVPFDYGISNFMSLIPEQGAPPPMRSGVVAINTGILAKMFIQMSGLALINFDEQDDKKKKLTGYSDQNHVDLELMRIIYNEKKIIGENDYYNQTKARQYLIHSFYQTNDYKIRKYAYDTVYKNETTIKSFQLLEKKKYPAQLEVSENRQLTGQRKDRFTYIKPNRYARSVSVCFTFLIFTFCKPDETSLNEVKEAIKSLQSDVIKLQAFVDEQAKKTLLIANTMNKNFKQVDDKIIAVSAGIEDLHKIVKAVNQYAINSRTEAISHFYRLIAEELSLGIFPAALIGNFTEVKKFRDLICSHKEFEDACLWGNNPLPYGMSNLAFGQFNGNLWTVASFNFVPKGFTAVKIYSLPHEVAGTCFKAQINYDRIVMSLDLEEIYWFDKDTVIMEWLNGKGPIVTKCHRYILLQTVLGYKPYLNLINWTYKRDKEYTIEQDIKRIATQFEEECTKTNSVLIILQDSCGITSPMPGFQWDPATKTVDFLGQVLFTASTVINIPVIIPDLPYKDFNGTGYIDTSEWQKQIDDEIARQKHDNENTKKKIDDIKPDSGISVSAGLGIGFGSFFLVVIIVIICYCVCKAPSMSSRFMFIMAIILVITLSVSGEKAEYKQRVWYLDCAKLGDLTNCPQNNTYSIKIVKTKKPPNYSVAEITNFKPDCGRQKANYSSKMVVGVAISIALLLLSMVSTIAVIVYSKIIDKKSKNCVFYLADYHDVRTPDANIQTVVKSRFIKKTSNLTIEGGFLCVDSIPYVRLIPTELSGNEFAITNLQRITEIQAKQFSKDQENGTSNPFLAKKQVHFANKGSGKEGQALLSESKVSL